MSHCSGDAFMFPLSICLFSHRFSVFFLTALRRSQHYLKLPVHFKPSTVGSHAGLLLVQSETSGGLVIQLTGEGLP